MDITLYTKEGCNGCEQVKKILANHNYSFNEYKIGHNITREEVLRKFPAIRYVPIIVVDEKVIGGANQLQLLLEQKSRVELLKD